MKIVSFVALLAFYMAPALAADTSSPAEKLSVFAGSWRSEGTVQINGKPVPLTGNITCAWSSPAHVFLVCDGVATLEGNPAPQHQLSVYTYDAASKQYGFANVTTNTLTSPDLVLNGNTWTYSGKATNAGKTTYFRTFNTFESADLYRFRAESSTDNATWSVVVQGVSRRL